MDRKTRQLIMDMTKAMNKGQAAFDEFIARLWTLPQKTQETFLWTALAMQMGHTKYGIPDIKKCKLEFSHIQTYDDLVEQWCSYKDVIKEQWDKTLGRKTDIKLED